MPPPMFDVSYPAKPPARCAVAWQRTGALLISVSLRSSLRFPGSLGANSGKRAHSHCRPVGVSQPGRTLLSSTLAGWLPWAWSAAEKGAVSAKGLAPPGEDHDRGPGAGLTSRPTKPPCVPKPTDSAQCRSAPRSLRLASYSVRAVDSIVEI
eukprot:9502095-Pyramimonas_sp.AAC.1